jgi:transcription initiation factor IIE alpha subunit
MAETGLADWVKKELMADETDELNVNKDRIKQLIRLTDEGTVLIENRKMTSREQIGLYYIGVAYAKVAGLRQTDQVTNKEIAEKLGMPEGTVHPKIKELRDEYFIEASGDGHRINYARMGRFLDGLGQKG